MKKSSIFLIGASIIVLLLCGRSAQAQDQKFGDWIAGQKDNFLFAKTANDTNCELHKACTGKSCGWFLYADVSCPKGARYKVLINSSTGNVQTIMTCMGTTPTSYMFEDSGLIDQVIDQAAQVSVAMPVAEGRIGVTQFSLRGATEALSQLRGGSPAPTPPDPCEQLRKNYNLCRSRVEETLKRCAAWPGPGPCPDLGPTCILPSNIDPRCTP